LVIGRVESVLAGRFVADDAPGSNVAYAEVVFAGAGTGSKRLLKVAVRHPIAEALAQVHGGVEVLTLLDPQSDATYAFAYRGVPRPAASVD
jgi:hypothetical protein